MTSFRLAEQLDSRLTALDQLEPVFFDLGTPELPEVEAIQEIVNMGTEIVPLLLERIQSSRSKQRIAYMVLVLNRIGDVRALASLFDLRARYQELETKDKWDYAVIGQCNLAIQQLQK